MKKRIIAVILASFMLLSVTALPVLAAENSPADPFPFDKYSDKYVRLYKSGRIAHHDNVSSMEYIAEGEAFIEVYENEFNPSSKNTLRASQGVFIKFRNIPGLDYIIGKNPYFYYSIELYDEADRAKQIETWEKRAERAKLSEAARATEQYPDGDIFTEVVYESGDAIVTELRWDDYTLYNIHDPSVLTGRMHCFEMIRPIKEIPGLYIYMDIDNQESLNNSHTEFDDATFALHESWRETMMSMDYILIWKDNFQEYDENGREITESTAARETKETKETKETAETKRHESVTQHAREDTGEDSGVSIPAVIVIGVGSAAAAVGAAAAASGSGKKDDDERKKKTYKMYVKKNFGDALRRGGDPVSVCARIAEIYEGTERDRDDLTADISVSGNGLTIHGASLSGRYCETSVSVPADSKDDRATVTFTYTGEGGTFSNSIIFRVSDGPQLKFLAETAPGSGEYYPYHENCGIDAIHGDGFTYEERFLIEDAPVLPKTQDITAVNPGKFDVEFEATPNPAVFKMSVKNNTEAEEEHDIFARPEARQFEIHVTVEGEKEPLKGYVTVNLYPEGISVQSRDIGTKNGEKYVRVQAYEKDYVGDLDKKWQVSEMKLTLAVRGDDKAIINPTGTEYRIDKLKGSGGRGTWADWEESLASKYEYKESWGIWNDDFVYTFEPNANLVEPDNGFFLLLLPVEAEYDGGTFAAEVPIRLRGRDIDPMEAWEKEYAKLKERIEKFSLPDNKDHWLKKFEEMANDPKPSVEELRLTSKYVVRQYMRYWTIEGMKHRDDAEMYDVIVNYLEWAKFFGDVAFSILVDLYAGPLAEALISPAKDFFTGAIGEVIAAWNYGQEIDVDKFEFSKNLAAAGDNLVSGAIDITNWKMAAATLGCYFAYASIKNFILTLREEDKFDIYGALVKGFSDMTSQALKAAAKQLFSAWLKNCSKFRSKVSQFCGKFVTKHLGEGKFLDMRNMDGLVKDDILRKNVDALFGLAVDKLMEVAGNVHDKIVESQTGFEFDENGHVIATFYFDVLDKHYLCSLDMTEALTNAGDFMTGGLFSFVYDQIFGNVPSAEAIVTFPKDPPLPKN
ncbi:MAG: hypothetical protein IJK77_02030 [Lachnospiraceae bacterium]|nr:hypothetical protein [Lachnospiraceae bacterium]